MVGGKVVAGLPFWRRCIAIVHQRIPNTLGRANGRSEVFGAVSD
jgi:hypothetical protein